MVEVVVHASFDGSDYWVSSKRETEIEPRRVELVLEAAASTVR